MRIIAVSQKVPINANTLKETILKIAASQRIFFFLNINQSHYFPNRVVLLPISYFQISIHDFQII